MLEIFEIVYIMLIDKNSLHWKVRKQFRFEARSGVDHHSSQSRK